MRPFQVSPVWRKWLYCDARGEWAEVLSFSRHPERSEGSGAKRAARFFPSLRMTRFGGVSFGTERLARPTFYCDTGVLPTAAGRRMGRGFSRIRRICGEGMQELIDLLVLIRVHLLNPC